MKPSIEGVWAKRGVCEYPSYTSPMFGSSVLHGFPPVKSIEIPGIQPSSPGVVQRQGQHHFARLAVELGAFSGAVPGIPGIPGLRGW